MLCAVIVSAVTTLVEEGIDALPGGAEATAAGKAVEGAKTFIENGLNAASFFGNWIGQSCGVPSFDFDLDQVFQQLINAPDALGKSKGCFKSGGCGNA